MTGDSMHCASIDALVALSRRYGGDPSWLLAGGGNTSYKDGSTLWIKASGKALATIGPDGFCAMDRTRLAAMRSRQYPADYDARESAVLADLMAARVPGQSGRPSVETLMHDLFPQAYVVHTHPALVNGLTCGMDGEERFRELFGDEGIWVSYVDPGLVLARAVQTAAEDFLHRKGRLPGLMFMQNHGLLVAAASPEGIDEISGRVVARLKSELGRLPDRGTVAVPVSILADSATRIAALAATASFIIHKAAASRQAFEPLSSSFSPDHIVYAGHEFLYVGEPAALEAAWKNYRERNGSDPRIVVIACVGAFALAASPGAAGTAMAFLLDACTVAVYAESFGGTLHMARERIDFIRTWEVERYRTKASLGAGEVQ